MPDGHWISVLEAKEFLAKVVGVKPEEIRLLFAGKELQDGRSMADYNTQKDATLHMILRCREDELTKPSDASMAKNNMD